MNTSTIDPAFSLPQYGRRMIQNFLLVWLDANFNTPDQNFQTPIKSLRHIVASINTFTDAEDCIDFLSEVQREKVFFIVSGSFAQRIVPEIQSMPQIESIYVLCDSKAIHKQWAEKIYKVKGVYTKIDFIYDALVIDRTICDRNMIPVSFNRLNPLFMYTQLLKDAIIQIEDNDDEQIKELVHFCQEQGDIDASQITQIQTEYCQYTPIWWYTSNTLMYSMLNRGLREVNTVIILKMQFFIRHLHQQIAELYKEQKKSVSFNTMDKFIVYRGQGLSAEVFEELKQSKGGLMSFNNFLSTSLDRNVSLMFAQSNAINTVGILFTMTIASRISDTFNVPFAHVGKVGYYRDEEAEILFTTHTIFRINGIQRLRDNSSENVWEVQLTLICNDDEEFSELFTHVKSEIIGEGWERVSAILLKMGEPEKAEQLYKVLLASITTDHGRAACLHQLGLVYHSMAENLRALQFHKLSLEIKEEILLPNDLSLVASYNNVGLVYADLGEYSNAVEYYLKSLEIIKLVLPPNHPNSATSYHNIGNVHRRNGEYSKALSYYQKGLIIFRRALPLNHPDMATSYASIGDVYVDMGKYSTALEYYQKSLNIRKIALPPNHPDLVTVYDKIGNVYISIGEYTKALESYQKSLAIWKTTLHPNHYHFVASYGNISSVYMNMGNYSKALEYSQKSLEISEAALPSNHLNLASLYNNIANLYRHMKEYSKALELHQKSLGIMKIALPPNHPNLASSYNNIANVCMNIGEYSKALEYYQKSLEAMKMALPPNHINLATPYNNIGEVYRIMGEHSKALKFYQKSLEIMEISLPPNHPHLISSYAKSGVMYDDMRDYSKALYCYDKMRKILEISLPPDHPVLVKIKSNIEIVKRKI